MAFAIPPGMTDECMVLKTRRAARAITRRYSDLLKPLGIQSTQASLLSIIFTGRFDSISDMAEQLAIERSALTRNLKILRDQGFITSDTQGRGRAQQITLTAHGNKTVEKFAPLWTKAQKDLRAELGDKEWNKIQAALTIIGDIA